MEMNKNFQFSIFNFQFCKGFTLLELMIAVAIIAGIGSVIAQAFFLTTKSNTKVEVLKDVKQNGDYAIAVMERMIRNSRSVTSSCAGTATASLSIKNPDGASTTFGCLVDSSVTRLASTSGTRTDYLTGTSVSLGGIDCTTAALLFTCSSVAAGQASVKISFTLSQKNAQTLDIAEQSQTQFQTSVNLRN